MEVHVGSIDEEDDEQGIAHMIEHVAFLGSKKREKLLGTGARSNAYTDFHHTVFHIHSPISSKVPFLLHQYSGIEFLSFLVFVVLCMSIPSNITELVIIVVVVVIYISNRM